MSSLNQAKCISPNIDAVKLTLGSYEILRVLVGSFR